MSSATDQAEIATNSGYEAPSLIELGSLVELAQGSNESDTADMKEWYN